MKVEELRALLDKAGVKAGRPADKQGMVEYLCALKENERCNIPQGVQCEDGLVCDASNAPGVCISPELASKNKFSEIMVNGRKIIGTKAALDALQRKLAAPQAAAKPRVATPPRVPTPPRVQVQPAISDLEDKVDELLQTQGLDDDDVDEVKPGIMRILKRALAGHAIPSDEALGALGISVTRDQLVSLLRAPTPPPPPSPPKIVKPVLTLSEQVDELLESTGAEPEEITDVKPMIMGVLKKAQAGKPIPTDEMLGMLGIPVSHDQLADLLGQKIAKPPSPVRVKTPPRVQTPPRVKTPPRVVAQKSKVPVPVPEVPPPLPKIQPPPLPKVQPPKPLPPLPKVQPPKPVEKRPPEGMEVMDIEEILRQIQQGGGEEIGELASTQRAVLKCLGLLA
jgi:hypothetical protein